MRFTDSLRRAWRERRSLVCVGLDPEPARLPAPLRGAPDAMFEFCRSIVDATADVVCCFKPQIAHFAAHAAEDVLERLIAHILEHYGEVPVILDAKRGDIGSTALHYSTEAYDRYGADAVTVNPYLGRDAMQPFLDRADRGVVLLCRTSNPGARDLQDLPVPAPGGGTRPLYQHVAALVAGEWNANENCALVVGATYPQELSEVRNLVGDMPILVPGVGAQGGDVEAVVLNGTNSEDEGLIISSSRAILYASAGDDYATAARAATLKLRDEINRYR